MAYLAVWGHEGHWVPEGGGTAERTLVRFDDEEEHRVYVLQETHQKSDAGGSMASDTNEKFDMEVDGDSMKVSYEYQYKALGHGSFITDLEEQASCTGTLERK